MQTKQIITHNSTAQALRNQQYYIIQKQLQKEKLSSTKSKNGKNHKHSFNHSFT